MTWCAHTKIGRSLFLILGETSILHPILVYPPKEHHRNEKHRDNEKGTEVSCEEEWEDKECTTPISIQECDAQT